MEPTINITAVSEYDPSLPQVDILRFTVTYLQRHMQGSISGVPTGSRQPQLSDLQPELERLGEAILQAARTPGGVRWFPTQPHPASPDQQ